MATSMIDSILAIDAGFSDLTLKPGDASYDRERIIKSVSSVFLKHLDYSAEQLDFLFQYLNYRARLVWQWLAAKANNVMVPFSAPNFANTPDPSLYDRFSVSSVADVVVVFKTNAGPFVAYGPLGFPYVTTVDSYAYNDPIWKRIITSSAVDNLTMTNQNWAGPSFLPITLDQAWEQFVTVYAKRLLEAFRIVYDTASLKITGLPNECNAIVFMKTLNADRIKAYLSHPDIKAIEDTWSAAISEIERQKVVIKARKRAAECKKLEPKLSSEEIIATFVLLGFIAILLMVVCFKPRHPMQQFGETAKFDSTTDIPTSVS